MRFELRQDNGCSYTYMRIVGTALRSPARAASNPSPVARVVSRTLGQHAIRRTIVKLTGSVHLGAQAKHLNPERIASPSPALDRRGARWRSYAGKTSEGEIQL